MLATAVIAALVTIGGFSLLMVVAYIATNVVFSSLYIMKANRLSVSLDSRIGGALADDDGHFGPRFHFGSGRRELVHDPPHLGGNFGLLFLHGRGKACFAQRLHRVQCPVLLLWGDSDRLVPPAFAEAYKKCLPQAELKLLAK